MKALIISSSILLSLLLGKKEAVHHGFYLWSNISSIHSDVYLVKKIVKNFKISLSSSFQHVSGKWE
jgi:hypothetical protein